MKERVRVGQLRAENGGQFTADSPLLGMDSHGQPERKGAISQVPVDENPYGVQALFFSIVG